MLKTDALFCCSGEVRRIMELRRNHGECQRDGGRGCEVLVGRRCDGVRTWGMGKETRVRGLMTGALLADETSIVILSTLIFGLAVVLFWMRGLMLGNTWPFPQVF